MRSHWSTAISARGVAESSEVSNGGLVAPDEGRPSGARTSSCPPLARYLNAIRADLHLVVHFEGRPPVELTLDELAEA